MLRKDNEGHRMLQKDRRTRNAPKSIKECSIRTLNVPEDKDSSGEDKKDK